MNFLIFEPNEKITIFLKKINGIYHIFSWNQNSVFKVVYQFELLVFIKLIYSKLEEETLSVRRFY